MKLAFVFPGQGSQKVGMGRALVERFASAALVLREADDALGFAISALSADGPEDKLRLTAFAQPAILAHSIALLRVLEEETELVPDLLAGHSLGEITALVAARAISLADAIRLVHLRGCYMQEAVPEGTGGMLVLSGVERSEVEALCVAAAAGQVLTPSNINAPDQIVVAGHTDAITRLTRLAAERGVAAKTLAVSAPFHCALMQPAAERLQVALASVTIDATRAPVLSNVDDELHGDAAAIRRRLVEQVVAPVRWADNVRSLVRRGVTDVVELGTSEVLRKLITRSAPSLAVTAITGPEGIYAAIPRARGQSWDGTGFRADWRRYTRSWRQETWREDASGVSHRGDGLELVLPSGAAWHFDDPMGHGF